MKNFSKFLLPSLILVFGMVISFSVLAQTDEADEIGLRAESQGIAFPVAELGNCGSKQACKTFCDDPGNIETCVAFAKDKGLMNQAEVDRATKFGQSLKSGSTPGGCTDPRSCQAFCSNIENMDTCLTWAEKNGLKDKHIEEAKKISGYLKGGGAMPGGCTSESSCRAYCENFDHADECFAFMEKVGLEISDGPDGGPPPKQVFELMKSGQTPGGCKSKNACEAYCQDESHFEECVVFAEKAGFMKPDEAAMARKTGGKGPGGCRGRECETYCNDSTHQEECFKFAEEHGLIPPEELKRAKEGFSRMKAGLENAPPEVSECLKSSLGPNIIEDIQAGKLTPGPQIGERVRECFERFGAPHDAGGVFKDMPPEVSTCLAEKGIEIEKVKTGDVEFTPEMGDTIRVCFQAAQLGGPGGFGPPAGGGGPGGPGGFGGPADLGGFLRSAPPEVAQCLQSSLGSQFESLKAGEPPTDPSIGEKIRGCFGQFQPSGPSGEGDHGFPGSPPAGGFPEGSPGGFPPGGEGGFSPPPGGLPSGAGFGPTPDQILSQFPGPVAECIKGSLSEGDLTDAAKIRAAAEKCFTQSGAPPAGGEYPTGGQYPSGYTPPPGGEYPSGSQYPSGGQYPTGGYPTSPDGSTYPSGGTYTPPPDGTQPPPGAYRSRPSLLGVIFGPLIQLLNR